MIVVDFFYFQNFLGNFFEGDFMSTCSNIENNGLTIYFSPDIEIEEDSVVWNGREVKVLTGKYDPSLPEVILCSKKGNHGKTASGFCWIIGGVALLFIPLPGARTIGFGFIVKGATDVSGEVMKQEAQNEIDKRDCNNRQINESLKK